MVDLTLQRNGKKEIRKSEKASLLGWGLRTYAILRLFQSSQCKLRKLKMQTKESETNKGKEKFFSFHFSLLKEKEGYKGSRFAELGINNLFCNRTPITRCFIHSSRGLGRRNLL